MTEDEYPNDPFGLARACPDAGSAFHGAIASAADMKNSCFFVLDANALLAPYRVGTKEFSSIYKLFSTLARDARLYIPKHAIREYLKHRVTVLQLIEKSIKDHKSKVGFALLEAPQILNDLEDISGARDEYKALMVPLEKYKKHLSNTLAIVRDWQKGLDPIYDQYRSIFTEDLIVEPKLDFEKVLSEYESRVKQRRPPGFKDASKDSNAIGDYIIWKTIIDLGQRLKKDCIFISDDSKPDWKTGGHATRFELNEEFRDLTCGNIFTIVSFAEFLHLLDVDAAVVSSIRDSKIENPKLDISFGVDTSLIRSERTIYLTIRVRNASDTIARRVQLSLLCPSSLQIINASDPPESVFTKSKAMWAQLARIHPGTEYEYDVLLRVKEEEMATVVCRCVFATQDRIFKQQQSLELEAFYS